MSACLSSQRTVGRDTKLSHFSFDTQCENQALRRLIVVVIRHRGITCRSRSMDCAMLRAHISVTLLAVGGMRIEMLSRMSFCWLFRVWNILGKERNLRPCRLEHGRDDACCPSQTRQSWIGIPPELRVLVGPLSSAAAKLKYGRICLCVSKTIALHLLVREGGLK